MPGPRSRHGGYGAAVTSDLDLRERAELCDLFEELGPDAPTLSGEWRTLQLAAHLVVRESHPASAGILVKPLERLLERARTRPRARTSRRW